MSRVDGDGSGLDLARIHALLGGARALPMQLTTPLDAHDMLARGMPADALNHLVDGLTALRKPAFLEKALGMSIRTIQRRKEEPDVPLSQEQSGRAWSFAALLAKATEVFGSQSEAEAWIERPAIGLDQRRPIDLLETPVGREAVRLHLERLECGVYT